jgi:nucleotide-binding universal stress UspA family protein
MGREIELVIELPEKRGIGVQLAGVLRAAAAGALTAGQATVQQALPRGPISEPRPWRSIRTVVVGSDGSETAAVAVSAAVDLAAAFTAALHVVSAYRSPDERPGALTALAGAEANIRSRALQAECHAREGDAVTVLVEIAEEHDADVIVVGSKGMSGPTRLLGSVPNSVSHRAPCSVMIVRTV